MTFRIDYETRMQASLRLAIRQILLDVAKDGLPGNHHFYISFNSTYPGVKMSPWLMEKYPKEMTIVIQNWFSNLKVGEKDFAIALNFNNKTEKMNIPWNSILNFSDPSVNFSLQFQVSVDDTFISVPNKTAETPRTLKPEKPIEKQKKSSRRNLTNNVQNKDNIIDFESFRKPN
ncbi:MAG: ClpXP protease specificity-enhancing factor SspB [Paracoccaceae bacterium]|nr:ClpXP protease specificity-enhancing factor SspB [Paracoccaceae bacterium]